MTEHKIVPIEPTDEMQREGARKGFISDKRTADIYRAMLAAAPPSDQSENTTLRSQVESLLAVNQVMRGILSDVKEELQHFSWRGDMQERITEVIDIKPGDIELVEVAEVAPSNNGTGLISAKYNSSPECGKLMYGDKLYVLKQKEGK